jgi:hypothetical protein
MIKFEFKRTNQELTAHYHPLAPVVGGTARALPPGPALVWVVPPGPGGRYPYRPCRPPRHHQQVVMPSRLAASEAGGSATH